ncbi:hypothetical protein K2F40_15565 [Clostridium sp. CM028]|uniref:hypothetical protein n=1 Tax=Clostridium sp. CM028 TaxID=2851575 RepID=UPI001C6F484C|nr:hypothetical protein [Clostridium sp. CM028]MBW9150377.1 hypothetical protein [Clostridium sp. CM028]WLC63551.1 hypothetical protein KTC94_17385 [Clostridium sp. CM028]
MRKIITLPIIGTVLFILYAFVISIFFNAKGYDFRGNYKYLVPFLIIVIFYIIPLIYIFGNIKSIRTKICEYTIQKRQKKQIIKVEDTQLTTKSKISNKKIWIITISLFVLFVVITMYATFFSEPKLAFNDVKAKVVTEWNPLFQEIYLSNYIKKYPHSFHMKEAKLMHSKLLHSTAYIEQAIEHKEQQAIVAEQNEAARVAKKEQDEAARVAKEKQAVIDAHNQPPTIGMTENEVLNSNWGSPKDKNKTTTANGTDEQWVYYNSKYLYFVNGRLETIQD